VTTDGNGTYSVPARLVNTIIAGLFLAMLSVIGSILLWWGDHQVVENDMINRLTYVEREIADGILDAADIRVTTVEARLDSIERSLRRIDDQLEK